MVPGLSSPAMTTKDKQSHWTDKKARKKECIPVHGTARTRVHQQINALHYLNKNWHLPGSAPSTRNRMAIVKTSQRWIPNAFDQYLIWISKQRSPSLMIHLDCKVGRQNVKKEQKKTTENIFLLSFIHLTSQICPHLGDSPMTSWTTTLVPRREWSKTRNV